MGLVSPKRYETGERMRALETWRYCPLQSAIGALHAGLSSRSSRRTGFTTRPAQESSQARLMSAKS
jgi:hypothetical protein